jgi:hypothetical protein
VSPVTASSAAATMRNFMTGLHLMSAGWVRAA